ncbi:MAG: integrase arm-type DNA-binding domain-containing protein [Xanthobacteraceae bacterium]
MPLTDTNVRNSKPGPKPFKLSDGGGMYLLVTPDGARYWRLDYRFAGKRRTLALGVYPTVPLAGARERREEARRLLASAVDPSAARKATQRAARVASADTFEAIAREWISRQRRRITPKYSALLLARLEADIFPYIGSRPVAGIDAPELLEVLRRVEKRGVIETARRLRQICGQVFRYAIATGRGKDDPTTALRGALGASGKPRNHRAMSLTELPEFLSALESYDGDPRTRLALRLVVLTFVRTTELRAAQWSEFEGLGENSALWRIPADRMKMKREHIVPLAPQAVAVLRELRALPGSEANPHLFPSPAREGYMSNNTMLYAMYRMGYHGRATVHGFRATASTALNEMGFRADVIERQLAHEEQNAIRAAYNRAEYLAERRSMMEHWARYLAILSAGNIVSFRPPLPAAL